MTNSLPSPTTEPGRIARRATLVNRTGWMRWLPGLNTLRRYELPWLRQDLVAGLVMTTMLVPVGIAYAEASGVPGINGLYATIVPLLAYALFGPSRILILGPDSALAPLILTVVVPLSAGDPQRAVAIGGMIAIVSGILCVGAGLGRLGFITELLSKPIRYGYMNGIALTVLLSQIPKLFGFSVTANGPLRQAWGIVGKILAGNTSTATFLIGIGTLIIILFLKRWPRVPGILIAVVAATVVVGAFGLAQQSGVRVLGPMPRGLPSPRLPFTHVDDMVEILMGGVAVALVSFADTSVLSRTYAARLRAPVDPNQEMVGLGIANLAAAFFQGFPISSSSSRTPVAEAAGAKTQLTGVVGCARHRAAPAVRSAAAPAPTAHRVGCRRHRRGHRPDRGVRPAPYLSDPALGVLALHVLLCRCGGARRNSGHWARYRYCRNGIPMGRLAPAFGSPRPCRPHQGLPRHHPVSGGALDPRPGVVPLGCAPLFRERRAVPRTRTGCGCCLAHACPLA